MSAHNLALPILLCNTLLAAAVLIFAAGFFPYKPFIPGTNSFTRLDEGDPPPPPFNRLIFMVVDALRSDFVYAPKSGFSFVQELINRGDAVPFTAHAGPPTITMPKIKAMTTGSVPSFLDVILNFAESDTTSTLAHMDTWVGQLAKAPNGKLLMYGDDTWLKLFPGFFDRFDGTSSFFVSDFTEVDTNVTRHISREIALDDWNGWVLHYLGLDHIGHKSGPQSVHMLPKQQEMDRVVKMIYEKMEKTDHLSSTLFVLCGDHGMNNAGNHGGSTPGETSPALVFMSPKLRKLGLQHVAPISVQENFRHYAMVEQSDIAPTLCGLLGIPIPLNNLGVFIPQFLPMWSNESHRLHLLRQNLHQIHPIVRQKFGEAFFSEEAVQDIECDEPKTDLDLLRCVWLFESIPNLKEQRSVTDRLAILYNYLYAAQSILSTVASNYDLNKMEMGILVVALVFVFTAAFLFSKTTSHSGFRGLVLAVGLSIAQGGMMFGSSFIEEEHHFWYWISSLLAYHLFLSQKHIQMRKIGAFGLFMSSSRIVRRWNQTGQKHAGGPDISQEFLPRHNSLLWILVALTYAYFGGRIASDRWLSMPFPVTVLLSIGLSVAALAFKVSFTFADAPELFTGLEPVLSWLQVSTDLVGQAQLAFALILFPVLHTVAWRFRARTGDSLSASRAVSIACDSLTLLLITETRVNNIPLFLLFEMIGLALKLATPSLSPLEIGLCSVVLQHMSFFSFGGTNAVSSIDLSNAYNGVGGYNVIAVGLLTFISNWSGPIWWVLTLAGGLKRSLDGYFGFAQYSLLMTFFASSSLLATMSACTLLRTHLFIWTVFSPKYLYSLAWLMGQHLAVNLALGYFLYFLRS